MRASIAPPAGSMRASPRRSTNNTARLAISGDNPMLLAAEDADKVGRANRAMSKAYKPAQTRSSTTTSTGRSCPIRAPRGPGRCSPTIAEDVAVAQARRRDLCRDARLDRRSGRRMGARTMRACSSAQNWLTGQNFRALKYTGPGHRSDARPRRRPRLEGRRQPTRATASSATPTFRPRKCSRRRTGCASTASCARPSRSATTAR